jgi:tail fiber domain protein|nr:MAG TPA: short tail fiber protein [Bacteriophage sp.]
MNLQANDKSYEALTVGSLNVLGKLDNDRLNSIHTHLQTSDAQQKRIVAEMQKLYENISADGVISANEKQLLKKEITIIEAEYPVVLAKAESAKKATADIQTYKQAYSALTAYLYSELKVFDDMGIPLAVDRDLFNKVFATYYKGLAALQIAKDGSDAKIGLPHKIKSSLYCNFDEKQRHIAKVNPSFTAWHSFVIEYDLTGRTEVRMSFFDALNAVIILKGEPQENCTFYVYFDEANGNGAKQYQFVYRLTGTKAVTITTGKEHTQTIVQHITEKTYGSGCYAVVDILGNVWSFTGELKKSDVAGVIDEAKTEVETLIQNTTNEYKNDVHTFVFNEKNKIETFIRDKIDEVNNAAADRFVRESGQLGEVRYFTSKTYTYGFLYANGYAFIPDLYPEYYEFWLANFADPRKKNYLGYDRFGYPKLPDLRGTALRAVDDGAGRCGADMVLEYQADAIRNITGCFGDAPWNDNERYYGGALYSIRGSTDGNAGWLSSGKYLRLTGFDASRVVPTAADNRVKNYAVYPFIKVI